VLALDRLPVEVNANNLRLVPRQLPSFAVGAYLAALGEVGHAADDIVIERAVEIAQVVAVIMIRAVNEFIFNVGAFLSGKLGSEFVYRFFSDDFVSVTHGNKTGSRAGG